MKRKQTSFGTMEILSDSPRVEVMTFEKEGKSHTHDTDEYCYVLSGSGRIVGADREYVRTGDLCRVAPHTEHWMVPDEVPFSVLIFYGR